MRKLKPRNPELVEQLITAARNIQWTFPAPRCGDLHHPKAWQHQLGEKCPAEDAAVNLLNEFTRIVYELDKVSK